MNNFVARILKIKNIETYTLVLILLAGLFLRLYKIASPVADWHSFRQVDTVSVSKYYLEGKTDFLHPKYHDISKVQSGLPNPEGYRFVEFPIFNYLNAKLTFLFPSFGIEVWGRLLSIFSALGSGLLLYYLGKRFLSTTGGLIACAFYLLNPYNVYFTRVILPDPMASFFALGALFAFVKFIDKENYFTLLVSSLLFSLALLVKPYTVFFVVPAIFMLFDKYKFKAIVKNVKLIGLGLLPLVPFFIWRNYISNFPEGIPFWKWVFNGDGIRFRPSFWYWIFGERLTGLILGYLGIVPFAIGVMAYEKTKKFIYYFIFGMFLYVSAIATASVKHDYYQIMAIPAVSLIFAWGAIKLWDLKEFNIYYRRYALVFCSLVMLLAGGIKVKEFYKINHPEIIEAGRELDKLAPKDALVIAAYNGDTAFLYQTQRRGWPVVELPIDELIKKGASYYLSVNLSDGQTQEFIKRFETVKRTDSYVILKLQ